MQKKLSSIQARSNIKNNHFHRWATRDKSTNVNHKHLASNRVYTAPITVKPQNNFTLPQDFKIFTIGSCFAREIETALLSKNHNVIRFEPEKVKNKEIFTLSEGTFAMRSLVNRYNAASILAEFENIFDAKNNVREQNHLIYEPQFDNFIDFHYTPALTTADYQTVKDRREELYQQLQEVKQADIIVITLGLTECWYDKKAKQYLNVTPGPRVMKKYAEQLEFRVLNYKENIDFLQKSYDLIKRHCKPDVKVMVTVSPVPLEVTFTNQDVILANCRSKSTLRCVAEEFCLQHDNVDYFPSYEMVTYGDPEVSWGWDKRHVTREAVDNIVNRFMHHYIDKE